MRRGLGLMLGGLLLLPFYTEARQAPRHLRTDMYRLAMIGHVAEAHLEASAHRRGAWSPKLILTLTVAGDPVITRPEPWSLSSRGPAGMLGATVAPLRFRSGGAQVSVLDLDMGLGTSGGASGTAFQVGVLKVGFPF